MIVMVWVTHKAGAKHELLFNKPASEAQLVLYGSFTLVKFVSKTIGRKLVINNPFSAM
jgi:hypothetical protein